MNAQVTVTLPNDLVDRAQVWADQSGRPLADFLAEAIEVSLIPFGAAPMPVAEWSNEDVLATLDFQLPPEDDERLSDLLSHQREEGL